MAPIHRDIDAAIRFTHVDPFEDTESDTTTYIERTSDGFGFTHVDPFEDTERLTPADAVGRVPRRVSPTSIRSRILKEIRDHGLRNRADVSPTSIRSRILKARALSRMTCRRNRFTHVDPFEDTERFYANYQSGAWHRFTHVDPFEDTERTTRLLKT